MKLFQYAIIWLPNEQQKKDGQKERLIKDITSILAVDDQTARILVAKQIPDEYDNQLDQVQIALRPF
jgi:hypothetical protein